MLLLCVSMDGNVVSEVGALEYKRHNFPEGTRYWIMPICDEWFSFCLQPCIVSYPDLWRLLNGEPRHTVSPLSAMDRSRIDSRIMACFTGFVYTHSRILPHFQRVSRSEIRSDESIGSITAMSCRRVSWCGAASCTGSGRTWTLSGTRFTYGLSLSKPR